VLPAATLLEIASMNYLLLFIASSFLVTVGSHANKLELALDEQIQRFTKENGVAADTPVDIVISGFAEGPAALPIPDRKYKTVTIHSVIARKSAILGVQLDGKTSAAATGEMQAELNIETKEASLAIVLLYHLYTKKVPRETFDLAEFTRLCFAYHIRTCNFAIADASTTTRLRRMSLEQFANLVIVLDEIAEKVEKKSAINMRDDLIAGAVAMAETELRTQQNKALVDLPKKVTELGKPALGNHIASLFVTPSERITYLKREWVLDEYNKVRKKDLVAAEWTDKILSRAGKATTEGGFDISLPRALDLKQVQFVIDSNPEKSALILIDPLAVSRKTRNLDVSLGYAEAPCCPCECCSCQCCHSYPCKEPDDHGCRALTSRVCASVVFACSWPACMCCCICDCCGIAGGKCTSYYCATEADRCCYSCLNCGKTHVEVHTGEIKVPSPTLKSRSLPPPAMEAME
jgi:hypothetical protein